MVDQEEYSIYIQANTLGLASYYLSPNKPSYIYYFNTNWQLDDGTSPPEKKYFINQSYNYETRQFSGTILWEPVTFYNDYKWEYIMTFSEDFNSIEGGNCTRYNNNGTETINYGTHLIYFKYNEYNAFNSIINDQQLE